ncbi:hypothetical protein, partial [Salmonella sp. s54925]|uniref:hypothetical protein n=1 Tax=Salmonella sp. s54925 TaxID=3159674 RepID=UPI00397FD54B
AKSQDKKGDKKISKDQGLIPKEGIAVDISGLKYIVDPFNDCGSKEDDSPEKVLDDIVTKYRNLSGKWSGLVGKDHVASVGEWQKLMLESTCF